MERNFFAFWSLSATSVGGGYQWRIQDFPEGGREPSRGGVNTPNFPENCMKSKEFGRPGGACVPHAPPRSANGYLSGTTEGIATEGVGIAWTVFPITIVIAFTIGICHGMTESVKVHRKDQSVKDFTSKCLFLLFPVIL